MPKSSTLRGRNSLMLTLPLYDLPTRSASGFLIRYVLPRSLPPQLIGPADRKALFSTMTIGKTLIGVGHGSPTAFCGENDQVLMDIYSIPDVKGDVVILISCETARLLGPELIKKGAVSYIGFREDLVWVVDADLAPSPWSDRMAAAAMIPVTNCVNTVLDGKTTGEALEVLTDGLSKSAMAEEDELIISCLNFNRKNATLLGDAQARVEPRPRVILPIPPPPIILPIWG